ncbi:putative phospholipid-transporting atpase [Anaeramoeba flamelloides]|uniref:Phospholipid-transporting ATPase n=1 Tax=Anaeramoeba flamelloides TaxID=1746091 RepID=A0AAV7YMD0_9EUKA|nr:putative phospholipid-transporting atpase [Anaeramoeba flamelloides]
MKNLDKRDQENEVFLNINDRQANTLLKFPSNYISTTRYTYFNFIPLNLFEQYRRLYNIYFLIVAIVTYFPFSPLTPVTSTFPIVFVLSVSAIKSGVEDWSRRKADRKANSALYSVYNKERNSLQKIRSGKIRVGDIIYIEKDRELPADIALLSTSDNNGFCSIETSNLDGEYSLKIRRANKATLKYNKINKFQDLKGNIRCTTPSPIMDRWTGVMELNDKEPIPLTITELLLRGSVLKNTKWIYGIVVYAGEDTKMFLNLQGPKFKFSRFDKIMNKVVILAFILQISFVFLNTILSYVFSDQDKNQNWYLNLISSSVMSETVYSFFGYMVLYSFMIPMSHFVTLEVVRYVQAYFMEKDLDMYDEDHGGGCLVRNSNLTEELCEVRRIFSDKTGTLTENEMIFKKCSILGNKFDFEKDFHYLKSQILNGQNNRNYKKGKGKGKGKGNEDETENKNQNKIEIKIEKPREEGNDQDNNNNNNDQDNEIELDDLKKKASFKFQNSQDSENSKEKSEFIKFFFRSMALCNNVQIEKEESTDELQPPEIIYEGESPDEIALVKAASKIGIKLEELDLQEGFIINENDNKTVQYPLLNNFKFNSFRKRMSIITRTPEGKIFLIMKGADSVVIPRLDLSHYNDLQSINLKNTSRDIGDRIDRDNGINGDENSKREKKIKQVTKNPIVDKTIDDISHFSKKGLRTLIYAYKEIDELEYKNWSKRYQEARSYVTDRDTKVNQCINEMERDLIILGATAIEDKLQPHVPETIKYFLDAGIKIWLLTGDKVETAISIAQTSNLIDFESQKIVFQFKTKKEMLNKFDRYYNKYLDQSDDGDENFQYGNEGEIEMENGIDITKKEEESESGGSDDDSDDDDDNRDQFIKKRKSPLTLILRGDNLRVLLNERTTKLFRFSEICNSIICCRVNPQQKSHVVSFVQHYCKDLCLAVGDGANDVSMIQQASIGVGILGKEGTQASRSSDYSITRFHHLKKLICAHGRWSYIRVMDQSLYAFYKNMIFMLPIFWYSIFNGNSATKLYPELTFIFFNIVYVSWPPLFFGIFEKDLETEVIFKYPKLFFEIRKELQFHWKKLFPLLLISSLHSFIIFFSCYLTYGKMDYLADGKTQGYRVFGTVVSLITIFISQLELMIRTKYWVRPVLYMNLASVASVFICYIVDSIETIYAPEMYGIIWRVFIDPNFYFLLIFCIVACFLPYFVYMYIQRNYFPKNWQILQEMYLEKNFNHENTQLEKKKSSRNEKPNSCHSKLLYSTSQDIVVSTKENYYSPSDSDSIYISTSNSGSGSDSNKENSSTNSDEIDL